MKILVFSGSIRAREHQSDYIFQLASSAGNLQDFVSEIDNYQRKESSFANTEILSGVALLSSRQHGAEVELFPLMKLFPKREQKATYTNGEITDLELARMDTLSMNEATFEDFKSRVSASDGVILVTPVYFGDRSSVANKLLQLSGIHNLLDGKVFGAISVGAKRNGGQETTIIYSICEALNQNALAVGNGPPTSQYGGTAIGGRKGTVIEDSFGLETSWGTGLRVAHVSEVLKKGKSGSLDRPVRIAVLLTMDDSKRSLLSFFESLLKKVEKKLGNVEFHIENVLNSTIYRCIGCNVCPVGGKFPVGKTATKEEHSHCAIKNPEDDMEKIHDTLLDADGIIIAGMNVKDHSELVYRYQVLIERTRHVRRNNFELTDKLVTAFTLNQVGAWVNSLHSIKTITSYIRHNTIIHRPIEATVYEGEIIDDGEERLLHFIKSAETIAVGRKLVKPVSNEYVEKGIGGY